MDYEHHPYTRVPESSEPETKDHEQIAARETPEAKLFDHEIELAIDRILASGVLPPPELVPTGAAATLTDENIDEQLPILEALADQCYRDGSFAAFPVAVVTQTGKHVDRIIALAQKFKNPMVTADHKERLPLAYVGAKTGPTGEDQKKYGGIVDQNIMNELERGGVAVFGGYGVGPKSMMQGLKYPYLTFMGMVNFNVGRGDEKVDSASKLLLGDREQLRYFLSSVEFLLADNARTTLGRSQNTRQEEWASLPHLLARRGTDPGARGSVVNEGLRRIDVFIAAAASGIHFEYIAKGFFQGLRDLGHDVMPPYFMGIWEKLHQFPSFSGEMSFGLGASDYVRNTLKQCPTYNEYEEYYKTHPRDDRFDKSAPLIYHILDQVTHSLRQAFDQRGNHVTVGIFDESINSGWTLYRMETFVQAAIDRVRHERGGKKVEVTLEYIPAMNGDFAQGRYPSWQGKFVDVQHGGANTQSERVVRPSLKEQPQAHALHRVLMALAQESGRVEARFLDQVVSENPVVKEQKQFVEEVEQLYRAPAQIHDSE